MPFFFESVISRISRLFLAIKHIFQKSGKSLNTIPEVYLKEEINIFIVQNLMQGNARYQI